MLARCATSRIVLIGFLAVISASLLFSAFQYRRLLTRKWQGGPPHPLYKVPQPEQTAAPPVVDNFPRAAAAVRPEDLPAIPSVNRPPAEHVPEKTPLFIGFTRNWRLLQQTVVSYIAAGWPPEDIYVVENTGVMDANQQGKLSLQNPFYLDHYRLTTIFGINVLTTPTLLTFSQLQNFYLYTAIQNKYPAYFWSHMDVAIMADERRDPYRSIYNLSVEAMRQALHPQYGRWAVRLFSYDHFALINTKAFEDVGGWDPQIGYYVADCDMYERLFMKGYKQEETRFGLVFDVAESLDNLEVLYRRRLSAEGSEEDDELGSDQYEGIVQRLGQLQAEKNSGERNTWQARQTGGQGEPYYRDPVGFDRALWMTVQLGRDIFAEKWGHRDCDIRDAGLRSEDAWRVDHDWFFR